MRAWHVLLGNLDLAIGARIASTINLTQNKYKITGTDFLVRINPPLLHLPLRGSIQILPEYGRICMTTVPTPFTSLGRTVSRLGCMMMYTQHYLKLLMPPPLRASTSTQP
jgi:hypothetical protein